MKIAVDTNIVLDTLARRKPFFEQSQAVMQTIASGKVTGSITANAITDIYYILRKHLDEDVLRTAMRNLMELLEVTEVNKVHCLMALDLPMKDYEDALLVSSAKSWGANVIVTRNPKDFAKSPIKALTPEAFLKTIPLSE